MGRRSIALFHPLLGYGGSEASAMWAIEALKNDYDVHLITGGKVELERLNQYYGTNLNREDFTILKAPMPFYLRNTSRFAAMRGDIPPKK